jgi:plastocyanin
VRARNSLRLGLVAAAVAGAGAGALVADAAQTQTVTADDSLVFKPSTITVTVGDTVHWKGSSIHTTTSDPAQAETWDSGNLTASGFDHTFNSAGTFTYHCTNHQAQGMVGKVVVQQSGGTLSQPTQTSPQESQPEVGFTARTLRSSRRGVVKLRVHNPNAFPITGKVRLDTARRVSVSARKRRLKLGTARFQIDAGATNTVKVKLSKLARTTLNRRRRLKVNVTFVAGTAGQTAKKTVKPGVILRAPKRS